MLRSSTSHSSRNRIRYPEPQQQVIRRTQRIASHSQMRSFNNDQTQTQNNFARYLNSKTPFRETGTTLGRGFSHRIRSSTNFTPNIHKSNERAQIRPNTTQKSHHRQSPLRLLSRKQGSQEHDYISQQQKSSIVVQTKSKKFLKKGSSINRAILLNIMKKKCKNQVIDNCNSYSNYGGNETLAKAIKRQLPKGIRDSIGSEQTMRMSNIFTGGNLKSINLHWKANQMIRKYNDPRYPTQQDQQITMKSIKRW